MAVSSTPAAAVQGSGCFKEAVCIDTKRIYDSVSDKDCLEDLQVYFTDEAQPIINSSTNVKVKKVDILNVYLDVESVPFNRGFYSVDMTFFFLVKLSAYVGANCPPANVTGIATFTKKVILYGSEGGVKVFCSDSTREGSGAGSLPTACLQVATPVLLGSRLVEGCAGDFGPHPFPEEICNCFHGRFGCCQVEKQLYITIGLFIIVQLERAVQIMVPTYDFCVPGRESDVESTSDPCELFKKLKFPTNEFFPPNLSDMDDD